MKLLANLCLPAFLAAGQAADPVRDIWILAGQSNMVGRANLEGAEQPDPRVFVLGKDGVWAVAREPLHEERTGLSGARIGAGLGLPFAKEMVRISGTPIGLVPVAVGGTSLWQWDPSDPKSLYASMMKRVRLAGGRVKGVLWYQGEADARTDRADQYEARFVEFVRALRRDLGNDALPVYYAQIGRYAAPEQAPRVPAAWTRLREVQRTLEDRLANLRMAATLDLEMEDHVHLNRDGLRRLGMRFAHLANGGSAPRLAGVRWVSPRRLQVRFEGVNGSLTPKQRVLGFTLTDAQGTPRPLLFRAWAPSTPGNEVVLEVSNQFERPSPLLLWYGQDFDPAGTLADERDMAVPAFGPIVLPAPPGVP